MPREEPPSAVPATAQQDGEARARWGWVEPAVWTERMLTALEEGVKGGKWFRLIDKVFAERNLLAGYGKVAANRGAPGVDHVTVEAFGDDLGANVRKLAQALRDGSYEPQVIRRVYLPKPGSNEQRPLGIPTCPAYCISLQPGSGLLPLIRSVNQPPRRAISGRLSAYQGPLSPATDCASAAGLACAAQR